MFNTFSLPGFQCIDGLLLTGAPATGTPATGTFISIDKFTKFCSRLRTEHYMHMINVMILLYHSLHYRTSVLFFIFAQFICHLQRKENSCYIMLKLNIKLQKSLKNSFFRDFCYCLSSVWIMVLFLFSVLLLFLGYN